MGLGRARSPAAKHFDAIYAVKQLYKITLMFNVQKSACMPLSAELILWITSHVQQHGAKKWGVRAHLDPTLPESEGVRTPTGSPPVIAAGR